MTWDPDFTRRVSDLVHQRGLDIGVAQALHETGGDKQLLEQLEQATDQDIAEVSRLWREGDQLSATPPHDPSSQ